MDSDQEFLKTYREEVQDFLSDNPESYSRATASNILAEMFSSWDDTQGNVEALNQIWEEEENKS